MWVRDTYWWRWRSFHTATFLASPGDCYRHLHYRRRSLIGQFAGSMPTVQAVLWHTILLLACLVCSLASYVLGAVR